MGKYVLAYKGGSTPESPEAQEQVMAAWGAWFGDLGDAVVDPGNPFAASKTVAADGSATDGAGSDPVTGYSVIDASSLDDAAGKAKGCPILADGGRVEVFETIDM
jgi:hypothetical protein